MTGDLFSDEVFYSPVPKLFPFSLSIPDGGGLLTWRGLLGSWCQVDLPFCFSPWWQGSIYLPRISECQVPSRFSDYLQDKVLLNWTGLLGARVQEFLFLFLSLMAGSSYLQGFLGTCKILFMSLTLMVGSTYLVMLSEHAAPSSFSFLSLSLVWGVAETFWAPNAKPIRFPIVPLSFMAMVCLPGIAFWVLGVRFPSVSLMVRVCLFGWLSGRPVPSSFPYLSLYFMAEDHLPGTFLGMAPRYSLSVSVLDNGVLLPVNTFWAQCTKKINLSVSILDRGDSLTLWGFLGAQLEEDSPSVTILDNRSHLTWRCFFSAHYQEDSHSVSVLDDRVCLWGNNFWGPDHSIFPFVPLSLMMGHSYLVILSKHPATFPFLIQEYSYFCLSPWSQGSLILWEFVFPAPRRFPFLSLYLMAGIHLPGDVFLDSVTKHIPY